MNLEKRSCPAGLLQRFVRRPFVRTASSESHIRQCAACVEVGRHADVSPALCVGCTGRLGVAGVLCRVAAYQEMCRQAIGGSQSKDDLSDLDWVAGLVAPVRLQSLDD